MSVWRIMCKERTSCNSFKAVKVKYHIYPPVSPDFGEGHLSKQGQSICRVPIIVIGTFIWARKKREGQQKEDQMGGLF